jgi:DNA-binding NtrC family response regulator
MAKEKILIVDDEPMIRWTLNEALRGWEYNTAEASTVAAALASFESERPAAVLLDINLPDGSGLDVLREIKKRQPQAVVIMITASVLIEDTLVALRGGAYDFIGKPVNLNELQITIRNGIEAGKLRKEVHSMRRDLAREFGFDKIIGELEIGLQAKLLRVLEEGAFRRVGGLKDLPLDVRVIAASNRDLKTASEARKFRLDLYYRLSVIQIDLPPLRERGDDVLLLTDHYIKNFNEKLRRRIRGLTPEVSEIFRRYGWPGNVRELRNVIERAMILEDEDLITANWLPRGVTPETRPPQLRAQPQEARSHKPGPPLKKPRMRVSKICSNCRPKGFNSNHWK